MNELPATREYERACKQRVAEATPSTYAATRIEYTAGEMHDELLTRVAELKAALERATKALRYGEEKDLPMLYLESQAALAERDKALDDLYYFLKPGDVVTVSTPGKRGSITFSMDRLTALRARAEEGSKP